MYKWQISLPFLILRLVKTLPFHEVWQKYAFRAEPPLIGYYKEYPPREKVGNEFWFFYLNVVLEIFFPR